MNPALYIGLQRYFLTFCAFNRSRPFVDQNAFEIVSKEILDAAQACDMEAIAYCYMPDHMHLLIEGLRDDSDALVFEHTAKQHSGYEFSKATGQRLWQPSFNDRILRDDEASISVARYIFENPVRAGLVSDPRDYPYLGSSRYSVEEILETVCWQP